MAKKKIRGNKRNHLSPSYNKSREGTKNLVTCRTHDKKGTYGPKAEIEYKPT